MISRLDNVFNAEHDIHDARSESGVEETKMEKEMDVAHLQRSHGIPGLVSIVEGSNGLPKVLLAHPAGGSAEVYLHGGHVTSWRDADGKESLFVSSLSHFAPDLPIRGGIPIVFPQFSGQGPLPAHGMARTQSWTLQQCSALQNGSPMVTLQLTHNPETLALWPHHFLLELSVRLTKCGLSLTLAVRNTGHTFWPFQMALHSYFMVSDIKHASVWGLEGAAYIDALANDERKLDRDGTIHVSEETDRLYLQTTDHLRIDDAGEGRAVRIEKINMPDVVVWNPWIDKSRRLPDFADDEYQRMLCVETGLISTPCTLMPDECWQGETVLCSGKR